MTVTIIPTNQRVTIKLGEVPVVKIVAGGPKGDRGPGIDSNISKITASITPPANPQVNDLWVDLS